MQTRSGCPILIKRKCQERTSKTVIFAAALLQLMDATVVPRLGGKQFTGFRYACAGKRRVRTDEITNLTV